MISPVSKELVEFKSWGEISEGDILHWMRDGKEGDYTVEFERVDSDRHTLYAKRIKSPYPTQDNRWSDEIYPHNPSSNIGFAPHGWVLEQKQFKYDPRQAGDLEEDV